MKYIFNPNCTNHEREIIEIINNFNANGILFGDGQRNKIKLFELKGKTINIKSFKIPHLINKIAYKYFRKSKARRSFEYATTLLEKGIGTPQPIAYFENYDFIGLKDSYYVSEHLQCDLTYRELVEIPDFPDHETILRQFTQFSFDLHEKGIEFLDHSPGNTLIKKNAEGNYDFFLVDLNRMNFHNSMDFDSRMKNLSHLTPKKEMIAVMSNEYSKLYTTQSEAEIFEKMWFYTNDFQERFARKRRLKKKLKFWKS
ncbi:lipopolysaccharide kinase InaA family protein [Flavobacterium nackdongense]|uniref:Kdo domain containing protein n=1 Tax=Flavobacterium nackdongense TaxID=2547394 RepID=A0A4P6YIB0_9FLAO|nr:lipopolysaccharide kinase InaA family protein [Flavobacterium nackdongense]QBN20213.1 Kdo domain containing protein [Flavobacterium nackdongense]